tara:strand:- start:215 stop:514 length:300 start_codon:yes stop_codon:yes gene_type:complete
MPLEISDFPSEIQVAFFIFGFLEDNWDGMSGSYMGKNWNNIEYLFNLYNIDEPRTLLYLMKLWEGILVAHRADKAQRKQKADERKSAGGGKNFTHNVKG